MNRDPRPAPAGPASRDLPPLEPQETALLGALLAGGVEGQSVLYIGGDRGALGLHVQEGGAAETTIVAANRYAIEDIARLSAARGAPPDLVHGHWIRGATGDRQFDNIVCSLPDCVVADPLWWIKRMMAKAGKRLIVEVDTPRLADLGYILAPFLWWCPVVWLPKPPKPGRQLRRACLLTPSALRNLFQYHTSAFEPVSIARSPVPGRLIVEARRRVVRNLVVVTGPTSSGKSTFAKRLVSAPEFRARFGLTGEWQYARGRDVVNLEPGVIENLIVELDLMAIETDDIGNFGEIPQFHILGCAEQVRILTVLPTPPPGHLPMSPAEETRVVRKCGLLGDALVAYYRSQGDGRIIRDLYSSWFDWIAVKAPQQNKLVLNDYSEFNEVPLEAFDTYFG